MNFNMFEYSANHYILLLLWPGHSCLLWLAKVVDADFSQAASSISDFQWSMNVKCASLLYKLPE